MNLGVGNSSASVTGGEGGGGISPAPFLVKTYEMVDDSSTDQIVSWSPTNNSFIVWNHAEFSRILLPTYFKHNNFSSFIRQLNTYGFRKIDPERWEFANDEFIKDEKHLLKNIYRRKPIHSHSLPPNLSMMNEERAALQEKIDKLLRETSVMEAKVTRFKQEKRELDEMIEHVDDMEKRQKKVLNFFERAHRHPAFVDVFGRKVEELNVLANNKKRKLPEPQVEPPPPSEDSHSSGNKLRLELSPAVSDMNMVSHSIQSSNEKGAKAIEIRREGIPFAPELADTGSCPRGLLFNDNTIAETRLTSSEETEGSFSCHLNLTLASAPLPEKTKLKSQEIGSEKNKVPQGRVNDVFWEQFLTEMPGSSDNEEASSTYRGNPYEEQHEEARRNGNVMSKNIQQLTL